MDYGSNAKKHRQEDQPEKNVKQVTSGEAIVKKKSLGRKVKDLFVAADFRGATRYVFAEVLFPAARNMVYDAATEGIKRMMYGNSRVGRSYGGSHTTYNRPVDRGYATSTSRYAPAVERGPRSSRRTQDDYIVSTRSEAEDVLDQMSDIVNQFGAVSVGDLHAMIGLASNHVDENWGWETMSGIGLLNTREGVLIDLPPAQPIPPQ